MRNAPLALVIVFLSARSACADMPGPFSPGTKSVNVVTRIEADAEYPEYDFVIVRFTRGTEPDTEVKRVRLPIEFSGTRRDWMDLFVVARSDAESYPSPEELVAAVRNGRVPVIRHRFESETEVPLWSSGPPAVTYRVQRNAVGDGLEIVRTSGNPLLPCYAVALVLSAVAVLGGLRLVRRRRRVTPPAA